MNVHSVVGSGGLHLHVREWGKADAAPILCIHGWSQNHLCWSKQYESALADRFRLIAFDLRGHGMSDAPLEPQHYTNAQVWAEDLAAIIDRLHLSPAVLVGWSYGGFIICDYLRVFGDAAVAGITFVDAAVMLDQAVFGTLSVCAPEADVNRGVAYVTMHGEHRQHHSGIPSLCAISIMENSVRRLDETGPGALRRPRNAVRDRNLDANEATPVDGPAMSPAPYAGGPVRREPPLLVF
jgi:pimeloyl-ACP methyl ester carboxylesterase